MSSDKKKAKDAVSQKNERQNSVVNSSLVYKLAAWHFGRRFFSYLGVNIMITLLFWGTLFYSLESAAFPPENQGIDIGNLIRETPRHIGRTMSDGTEVSGKSAIFNENGEFGGFYDYMEGAYHEITIPEPNTGIGFVVKRTPLGETYRLFMIAMTILSALEVFNLLTHIKGDIWEIRKRLRPIAELTRTAKNFNVAGLAGTINAIDVDQLDKRITVDSAQSELKDLASAINAMLDRIDEAYRAQIRFVSDASHELRTPIAVIQGYANLLDRWGKDDPKALTESIDAIKSEADGMKNLVEQLLFLARGDNDTMELRMETINVSELCEEVFKETSMIDPNHVFASQLDEPVSAYADVQLLKQAIRIFVDNAIKYTPAGERISLFAKSQGEYALITVQDNGIGIPEKDVQFVFDRFFRADESRARKTGGTGLGIAIAKWIIDKHEGSVEVISRQEIGTRIIIKLPIKKEE